MKTGKRNADHNDENSCQTDDTPFILNLQKRFVAFESVILSYENFRNKTKISVQGGKRSGMAIGPGEPGLYRVNTHRAVF